MNRPYFFFFNIIFQCCHGNPPFERTVDNNPGEHLRCNSQRGEFARSFARLYVHPVYQQSCSNRGTKGIRRRAGSLWEGFGTFPSTGLTWISGRGVRLIPHVEVKRKAAGRTRMQWLEMENSPMGNENASGCL